jgi:hypothetical protein
MRMHTWVLVHQRGVLSGGRVLLVLAALRVSLHGVRLVAWVAIWSHHVLLRWPVHMLRLPMHMLG